MKTPNFVKLLVQFQQVGIAMKSADGTAALEKALDVLEAIGSAAQGVNQAQLAEQVRLPRTTLYRILGTLVERGMVRRDPLRKVYRLGFRYLELVRNAYLKPDLVAAASGELRALRDLTGETSYLAVLDGNQVMSLERCDGAHTTRSAAVLGQSKPVYCTGQGKAILSALRESERESILKGLVLTELTPRTLTDRRRLQVELQATSARGYAIDDEEIVLGVRCVAAPIIDDSGVVHGALSVAGPAYRLPRSRLELLGPELADAARRVGAQLRVAQAGAADSTIRTVGNNWSFHGAFARWCDSRQALYWADTLAPAIHVLQGVEERVLIRFDAPINALELLQDGLLVCHGNGWSHVGFDGHERPLQDWPGKGLLCLAVDPHGAVWACVATPGGCRLGELSAGQLRDAVAVAEPIGALRWDAGGEYLYATAPESGSILRLQKGQASLRRLATLPKGAGRPGGLAVDSEGGIWTTLSDGWSLVRFSADGSLDRMIGLPVPCPTDLCLGGVAGDELWITTSRQSLTREILANAPASGYLLALRPADIQETRRDG